MGNFLTWNFWFSLRPGAFVSGSLRMMLGFIGLLIILTIAAGVVKRRWAKSLYANFWSGLFTFFWTNALIGLLLTFFNYEMVPFFVRALLVAGLGRGPDCLAGLYYQAGGENSAEKGVIGKRERV